MTTQPLLELIKNMPDYARTYKYIRSNDVLTPWMIHDITTNPNLSVNDWNSISANLTFTLDFIVQHPTLPWKWGMISQRSDVTWEIVQRHLDYPWNWVGISFNSNITCDIVLNNLNYPWDWNRFIDRHKFFTSDIVRDNIDKDLNFDKLSAVTSLDVILAYPDKPWNWRLLTSKIPSTYILDNLSLPWDWSFIHCNFTNNDDSWNIDSKLVWNLMLNNLDKNWNWSELLYYHSSLFNWEDIDTTSAMWNIIERHSFRYWPWENISKYAKIDFMFVKTHLHFTWSWDDLFKNKNVNITFSTVMENPDTLWDWNLVHTIATFDNIIENLQLPWNWDRISMMLTSHEGFLYNSYVTSYYYLQQTRQKNCLTWLNVVREELIKKTCHPERYFDWCLDDNEKRFIRGEAES